MLRDCSNIVTPEEGKRSHKPDRRMRQMTCPAHDFGQVSSFEARPAESLNWSLFASPSCSLPGSGSSPRSGIQQRFFETTAGHGDVWILLVLGLVRTRQPLFPCKILFQDQKLPLWVKAASFHTNALAGVKGQTQPKNGRSQITIVML